MRSQRDWMQGLTDFLFAHARRVMPSNRAEWVKAMQQEGANIPDAKATLFWALGSVATSYFELLKTEHFFPQLLARLCLTYVCLTYALDELNPPWGSPQCRQYGAYHPPRLPFERFLFPPLPQYPLLVSTCHNWDWAIGVPLLLKALWLITAILYFFAALRLLQNRASAFALYLCGLMSGAVTFVVRMSIHTNYFGDQAWYWQIPPLWRLGLLLHPPGALLFLGVLFPGIVALCIALVLQTGSARKTPG